MTLCLNSVLEGFFSFQVNWTHNVARHNANFRTRALCQIEAPLLSVEQCTSVAFTGDGNLRATTFSTLNFLVFFLSEDGPRDRGQL